jgi:hypothetical protein
MSLESKLPAPGESTTPAEMPETAAVVNGEAQREEIAQLAYRFFQERGGSDGAALDDWLRAELELRGAGAKDSAA